MDGDMIHVFCNIFVIFRQWYFGDITDVIGFQVCFGYTMIRCDTIVFYALSLEFLLGNFFLFIKR